MFVSTSIAPLLIIAISFLTFLIVLFIYSHLTLMLAATIGAAGAIFAAFFFMMLSSAALAERIEIPEEMSQAAKEMKSTVDANLGTADKIKSNAHTPLTSDKKLKTYDGKTEFDAKLFCSTESTFAQINMITKPNGNLVYQSITLDTNADGVIDTAITPNYEASAICANGFMHCTNTADPSSCRSYKWFAADNNVVSAQQVPLTELGGCYCINNSCGSNLSFSNNKNVMKDIGSGIAGALAANDRFFTLTEVKVDGLYAELKGSHTKGCTASDLANIGSAETISATDYYKNPSKLSSDGFAHSGNNALYDKIANSGEVGYTQASCEIKRIVEEDKVTLQDIIAFDSGTGGLYPIDDNRLRIILGKVGDDYWKGNCSYFELQTSFFVAKPERIRSVKLNRALFDDWMQVHLIKDNKFTHLANFPYGTWTDPHSNVPGKCELKTSWDMDNLSIDITPPFKQQGQLTFRTRVEVSGEGEGYIQGDIEVDTSCKVKPDTFTDTCKAYSQNKNCTLLEETVDGVVTFTNGFPTGLNKLPSSVGQYCGAHQIRDWSSIKRRYRCEDGSEWNFEKGFDRVGHIKNSIEGESYGDQIYNEDGTIKKSANELTLFEGMGAVGCEMTCKTERPRIANDVNLSGVVASHHTDPKTVDYFYHQCTGENFDVCPAGEGESIIKQCGCISEFGEVAGKLQAIRLAADDMICSDGEEKEPDGTD